MNILHIAPIGYQSEGIGTVLLHLEKEQKALGHDVRIVTKYKNKVYNNWNLITINNNRDFLSFLELWAPDIVLFHSLYEMEFLGFAKLLNQKKIPYAVQMHGALSKENYKKSHFKKMVANWLWYNSYLKKARCIIYLNQAEYENCVVRELNPNYAILPNGCEEVSNVEQRTCVHERFEIVFIGRININHKGLDELAKAIQILKNGGVENIHFSFYGNEDDPDVETFKQMILGLQPIAEYYGGIYGEEKKEKLLSSDLFILTSRYEGMPMGVLEAISYGLPCIVTPGTNMADIISEADAGWIADFSAESISNTIFKAIADLKDRKTVIKRNAYELSKKYSWKEIAKKSIKILSRCIE